MKPESLKPEQYLESTRQLHAAVKARRDMMYAAYEYLRALEFGLRWTLEEVERAEKAIKAANEDKAGDPPLSLVKGVEQSAASTRVVD